MIANTPTNASTQAHNSKESAVMIPSNPATTAVMPDRSGQKAPSPFFFTL